MYPVASLFIHTTLLYVGSSTVHISGPKTMSQHIKWLHHTIIRDTRMLYLALINKYRALDLGKRLTKSKFVHYFVLRFEGRDHLILEIWGMWKLWRISFNPRVTFAKLYFIHQMLICIFIFHQIVVFKRYSLI